MHDGRSSDPSVNELVKEGHTESPNGLQSSPKPNIIKTGNQLNGHISNFTHDQKIKNKNNLCVYFKRTFFHF